jgi:hypothetical protein
MTNDFCLFGEKEEITRRTKQQCNKLLRNYENQHNNSLDTKVFIETVTK